MMILLTEYEKLMLQLQMDSNAINCTIVGLLAMNSSASMHKDCCELVKDIKGNLDRAREIIGK